jgi:hypothetical protein
MGLLVNENRDGAIRVRYIIQARKKASCNFILGTFSLTLIDNR